VYHRTLHAASANRVVFTLDIWPIPDLVRWLWPPGLLPCLLTVNRLLSLLALDQQIRPERTERNLEGSLEGAAYQRRDVLPGVVASSVQRSL